MGHHPSSDLRCRSPGRIRPGSGAAAPFALLAVAGLVAGGLLGFRQHDEAPANVPEASATLRIVLTGDSAGQLRVCRCSYGQHGGWERLATVLKRERAAGPLILVDAGAFVRPQGAYPDKAAEATFRILSELDYDAVNVAEHEMGLGRDALSTKAQAAGIQLLSANLVDSNGDPVFSPFTVKTIPSGDFEAPLAHDLRVGILGLTSAACDLGRYATDDNSSLRVRDPVEAAQEQVRALSSQADLVVAVCDLEAQEIEALVARCPEIDAVACGRRHQPDDLRGTSRQVGKTLVFYGGKDLFQHYALLEFALAADGKVEGAKAECILLENGQVAEDAGMAELVGRLLREQAASISAQVASRPGASGTKPYVGVEVCKTCHPEELRQWQTTGHARAFQTLTEPEQMETDCVSCHTTGFGKGGFLARVSTPELGGVQCEVCHGAGAAHAGDPSTREGFGDPMGSCAECHTERRSPEFNPEAYRSRILHKAAPETD